MLPTLTEREKTAVAIYNDRVQRGDLKDTEIWPDDFSSGIFSSLCEDDEIIDIGCRIGRFIPLLSYFGIRHYFGIDPSESSIDYCNKTFTHTDEYTVGFAVNDARTLSKEYPERFGGFVCSAVLMHIPHADVPEVLTSIRGCLKSGAQGYFSTPLRREGDPPEFTNHCGMTLSLFTMDELAVLFQNAGFEVAALFTPDDWMILGHFVAI